MITTTALLIIDMQNDFCAEGGVMAQEGVPLAMVKQMAPQLANLIKVSREIGLSRIFVKSVYGKKGSPYLSETFLRRAQRNFQRNYLEAEVCAEQGWGGEFYPGIPHPDNMDVIIRKHRYSAFYGTDLEMVLRSCGINTVVCTGVMTNVCVESAARDAFLRDFEVIVLSDCTASASEEEHNASLLNIQQYFGRVLTSKELLEEIAPRF